MRSGAAIWAFLGGFLFMLKERVPDPVPAVTASVHFIMKIMFDGIIMKAKTIKPIERTRNGNEDCETKYAGRSDDDTGPEYM